MSKNLDAGKIMSELLTTSITAEGNSERKPTLAFNPAIFSVFSAKD